MKVNKFNKQNLVYVLSGSAMIFVVAFTVLISLSLSTVDNDYFKQTGAVYNILNRISIPVNSEAKIKLIRPYSDDNVKVVKGFYDYLKSADEQMNSIIYYEDTYMQSTGTAYSLDGVQEFQVRAALDGEVLEVLEDQLIGNSIVIKHNNIKLIYQSLSEIDVKVGDKVAQGSIIGVSGTSNVNSVLGNHLYFELVIENEKVNPEEYYDKEL